MRGTRTALTRRWYAEGWYQDRSVREHFAESVERWGDKKIVVWSYTRPAGTTLGDVHLRGRKLAGALLDRGFGPGDVLALQMPNWVEAVVAYHAAIQIGVVLLPIIHVYGATEVDHILRSSGARGIVTPQEWSGMPYDDRDYPARHPGLQWIVVGERAPEGAVTFAELEEKGHDRYALPDVHADDVHIVNYTSGTTARPKGVLHTHNSLLHEDRALGESTADRPGLEVMVSPNPVGHIAGLLANVMFPVLRGQDVVMMDGWDPGACLELYATHGATRSGGAPFFLQTLLEHPDLGTADLSQMRVFGCGGAGVAPSLIERADAAGLYSFRSYGSTEHPSTTAPRPDDALPVRAHTDGRPLLGVQLKLVDANGDEVPEGTPGEILSVGPDLCVGYKDEDHNGAFDAEGWYHTGDVGVLEDGCLRITGRIKDLIIRGGENISAQEVEGVLVAHPKVLEAAAVAVPDDRYGEKVCAFVVVRSSRDPLAFDEMTEHFREAGIARQKTPERLEIVDDLPKTLAGKVQKFKLREQLGDDG